MSNILDAIRKAETERLDDSVPTLESMVQERRAHKVGRKKRRFGGVIWLALILVIACAGYLYKDSLIGQGAIVKQRIADKSQTLLAKVGADSLIGGRQSTLAVLPKSVAPSAVKSGVDGAASGLSDRQKQLLNALRFDVVSFSQDSLKRFAMIGSHTYREGDQLEGFPITQITVKGVFVDVGGENVLIRP